MTRVGVLYQGLPAERPSRTARWVEELGYDSLWVGDHVLSYVDGIAVAAAAGAVTERLTVGTAILLVPLRNPALLARSLATLATELPDRFVLGAGAGGDLPAEFAVVGVETRGRGARMEETVRTVRTALDDGVLLGEPFADRPRRGCPPVWFGGRTSAAAQRVARIGDGFLPYLVTPERYTALCDEIRAATTRPVTFGVDVMVSLGRSREQAWADAQAYRAYGLDDERLRRHTALGTADDVAARLGEFVAAGAEHLVLHVTAPPERKRAQIEELSGLVDRIRDGSAELEETR